MRLRRKGQTDPVDGEVTEAPGPGDVSGGPWDADDLDLDDDPTWAQHIDLGGLLLPAPPEGIDLQLQVDEASGEVLAVLLAGQDGALELRPFAAARNSDLWAEVRGSIRAEATRHGGTSNERSGDFGTELLTQLPVTTPEGQSAIQPSRVIGVVGPRWLLRATLLGRPAVEPDDAGDWEALIRSVVVRRGAGAMPPGEALPLTLPHTDE